MKLFLSSLAISDTQAPELIALVGKPAAAIKLALIENASDPYDDDSVDWVDENRIAIQSHGFEVEIIDLRKYEGKSDELREKLAKKDVIWLGGGNTFYLRWILQQTGADEIIIELCKAGTVYGGGSAGAIVAGPTVDHFQTADDPNDSPGIVLDGLHLTETVAVPHVDNLKYGIIMVSIVKNLQADGRTVVQLTDAQALIVDGDESRVK